MTDHGPAPENVAVLVCIGGRSRRMNGVSKPDLRIGTETILERLVHATSGAAQHLAVGHRDTALPPLPETVSHFVERPPYSGPAFALAQAAMTVPRHQPWIALLAGDLPYFDSAAFTALRCAARPDRVTAFTDETGRPQWLTALWPRSLLVDQAETVEPNGPMRSLYQEVEIQSLTWNESPRPWQDCDTFAELHRARRILA